MITDYADDHLIASSPLITQRIPVKLTIKQAAAYLNISEITVRRRIKRGDLVAVKEDTPQGFVWMIELAEVRETDQPADHVDYAVTTQLPDQRLITELEDQVFWLRRELEDRRREHDRDREDWRNEIERLHTLMAQQGQTLQALSASLRDDPRDDDATDEDTTETSTASIVARLRRLIAGNR